MTITLLALSLNDSPLTQPITACFDARGGTIGRADHNTMALPDPERHISRLQAEVRSEGSRYLIKNVGAANPISVGTRQLQAGESFPLSDGDTLRIGGYLLRVIDDDRAQPDAETVAPRRAATGYDASRMPTSPGVARSATPEPNDFRRDPAHSPAAVGSRRGGPRPQPGSTGLSDIGAGLSSDNPFADLLGGGRAPAQGTSPEAPGASRQAIDPFADLLAPPAGLPADSSALGSKAAERVSPVLPEDFDPFATPAATAPAPPAAPADPFADLKPVGDTGSIDQMFDLPPRSATDDALARFGSDLSPGAGSRKLDAGLSTDPLDLFGGSAKPSAPPDKPFSNHTPDLHAAFDAPRWVAAPDEPAPRPASGAIPSDATWLRPRPSAASADRPPAESAPLPLRPAPGPTAGPPGMAPRPPASPAPAVDVVRGEPAEAAVPVTPRLDVGTPAATDVALWRAFCEGAGLDLQLPNGLDEQAMRTIGQVLQAAVAGTLQLIAVRASTKLEMRADVTMIQPRANNPLKFAPDAQTGLEQLLVPPMRGFMAGPAAMRDAMNDLVGHSIGTMAGMRAALDGILTRFEPNELESKLSGKSLLDSVLPMNRKARLWDLYRQHFDAIREEAQEDFHTLFGKAFLAAYEQQVDRLKASRDPR